MDLNLWSLIQALRGKSGNTSEVPLEEYERSKAGAEELSKYLPEFLMPRKAIEEDRRRKAAVDKLLSETR